MQGFIWLFFFYAYVGQYWRDIEKLLTNLEKTVKKTAHKKLLRSPRTALKVERRCYRGFDPRGKPMG
jgi:hypothetical protein